MHRNIEKMRCTQHELEDALRLETNHEDVKDTKYGKQLLRYLKKRHRVINSVIKNFDKKDYV